MSENLAAAFAEMGASPGIVVPEPATYSMILGAMTLFIVIRRRKR